LPLFFLGISYVSFYFWFDRERGGGLINVFFGICKGRDLYETVFWR